MALPVYYINQSWNQTYGEETNRIVVRAFAIFASVIYEFKNKETKKNLISQEEFLSSLRLQLQKQIFNNLLAESYPEGSLSAGADETKSSSVINSLSFNLSPYVKMLPRFDAIPVIISCMRQDDIRIVKMAVDTLTLLCQWNGSFVKIITDYMFSSTVITLLRRLRFNLFHNVEINYPLRKTRNLLLQKIRSNVSRDFDDPSEEEMRRNAFTLDVNDSFFTALSNSLGTQHALFQDLFTCSPESGQEELLHSVLLLLLYMEGNQRAPGSLTTELVAELHASECEDLLIGPIPAGIPRRLPLPLHRPRALPHDNRGSPGLLDPVPALP